MMVVLYIHTRSLQELEMFPFWVQDTARTCEQYLSASRRKESEEQREKAFTGLVLRGKLRTAVQWITKGERGAYTSPRTYVQRQGISFCKLSSPSVIHPIV